jgi:hypothetical protein
MNQTAAVSHHAWPADTMTLEQAKRRIQAPDCEAPEQHRLQHRIDTLNALQHSTSHVKVYCSLDYREAGGMHFFHGRGRSLAFNITDPKQRALADKVVKLQQKVQQACDEAIALGVATEQGPARPLGRDLAAQLTYKDWPDKWRKWADIVAPRRPDIAAAFHQAAERTDGQRWCEVTLSMGDWEHAVDLQQADQERATVRELRKLLRGGLLARLWAGFLAP